MKIPTIDRYALAILLMTVCSTSSSAEVLSAALANTAAIENTAGRASVPLASCVKEKRAGRPRSRVAQARAALEGIAPANVAPTSIAQASVAPTSIAQTSVAQASLAEGRSDDVELNQFAKIIQHEDERIVDGDLIALLKSTNSRIKQRAMVALGRIGEEASVLPLLAELESESGLPRKALAAFELGETERASAVPSLLKALNSKTPALKARAVEALGKIAFNKESAKTLGKDTLNKMTSAIVGVLASEPPGDKSSEHRMVCSLALIALLRIKDPSSISAISAELNSADPAIRWQAANVLSRTKDGIAAAIPMLRPRLNDDDALVRTYAARALGVAKDKDSVEKLVLLLKDPDEHVVSSAITALGTIADSKGTAALLELGNILLESYRQKDFATNSVPDSGVPTEQNMLLLIATAFGEIKDENSLAFLQTLRREFEPRNACPEIEIALAKFGEKTFFNLPANAKISEGSWQTVAARAQGLGELKGALAKEALKQLMASKPDARAVSEILNGLAAVKADGLLDTLIAQLKADDVIVRATAAGLLADNGESSTQVTDALAIAFSAARKDKMNDARLAILEASAKLKHPLNKQVLSGESRDPDYIVRRRAIELMKESGEEVGDLKATPIDTGHDSAYWIRMAQLSLAKKNPHAIIHTKKGDIHLELFASDSPMMVDNFIHLAQTGFYNGLSFMRVVPNFVVQGGDPRNDMNGGPGYQVRCEINLHPYITGTIGIALSGKDTGGSQFFLTHLPQPHLDGGYTVMGQLSAEPANIAAVNRIARGDLIERIEIRGDE